jgi:pimeloyl-ACP methyl ester carboxylesterase
LVLIATAARLPIDPAVLLVAAAGEHKLEELFARLGFSPSLPPAEAARLAVSILHCVPGMAEADLRACTTFDARDRVRTLQLPSHVIIADDDRLVPTELSRELASLIPGARSLYLPRAGHFVPLESADRLAAALG